MNWHRRRGVRALVHRPDRIPIVDAGIRQLAATVFMHNRVRMIVAMFLTKDLHLDWREGERWFMQRLVDGEIASNNGGWQWSASTVRTPRPIPHPESVGADGAFRSDGAYVRRVGARAPRRARQEAVRASNTRPGSRQGYPLPIVHHSANATWRSTCIGAEKKKRFDPEDRSASSRGKVFRKASSTRPPGHLDRHSSRGLRGRTHGASTSARSYSQFRDRRSCRAGLRAALADDDVAGDDRLTAKFLNAKTFADAVAPVLD